MPCLSRSSNCLTLAGIIISATITLHNESVPDDTSIHDQMQALGYDVQPMSVDVKKGSKMLNASTSEVISILKNEQFQGVRMAEFAFMAPTLVSVQVVENVDTLLQTNTNKTRMQRTSDVLKFEPSGRIFETAATIFIVPDRRVASTGKRFGICKYNETLKEWQEQPNSYTNTTTGVVSVKTNSFSYWAVFEFTVLLDNTPTALPLLKKVNTATQASNLPLAIAMLVLALSGGVFLVYICLRVVANRLFEQRIVTGLSLSPGSHVFPERTEYVYQLQEQNEGEESHNTANFNVHRNYTQSYPEHMHRQNNASDTNTHLKELAQQQRRTRYRVA